ncbi:P13 family porin [Borreliella carolinensis]|uniref:P13 family porin n=1 Tax=Borreliella carolinensis TaxID=478174 RepID=A0ACD5GKG2_9SPIR
MNAIVTLGIGSFVQGDYIGDGALLGSQVLEGILVLTGYGIAGHSPSTATALVGIGCLTISASHITGLIIPFAFANKHNENLKKRLGIALAGFEPNFDIGINGFQLSF